LLISCERHLKWAGQKEDVEGWEESKLPYPAEDSSKKAGVCRRSIGEEGFTAWILAIFSRSPRGDPRKQELGVREEHIESQARRHLNEERLKDRPKGEKGSKINRRGI